MKVYNELSSKDDFVIIFVSGASDTESFNDLLINNSGMLAGEESLDLSASDGIYVVEIAVKHHMSDLTTKAMSLVALLKLSGRFPSHSQRIKDIIIQCKGSLLLELQQRAIEFNSIIERHQNIRSTLLERMPLLDEATYSGRRAGSLPPAVFNSSGTLAKIPNGIAKTSVAAPLVDLLDPSSDDTPMSNSSGTDFLNDLLGFDLSSTPSQSEKENMCLYAYPIELSEVRLPVEEVPPEIPEPVLHINFTRDGT